MTNKKRRSPYFTANITLTYQTGLPILLFTQREFLLNVWGCLSCGVRRRCHSADCAARLDDCGNSAGQIPFEPIDSVAALRFGFNHGTIPDESLHPPIHRPVHQTAQNRCCLLYTSPSPRD